MILRASHTLAGTGPEAYRWIQGGGVQLRAGRIERVFEGADELKRAARGLSLQVRDLGSGYLLPGLVNAHAHLELSHMRLASGPFAGWIGDILRARRKLVPEDYAQAVVTGEARLLATGTTCVGDIASMASAAAQGRRLRSVVYREVLDAWDPARSAASMAALGRALPKRKLRIEGLSPHAPYSTSAKLLGLASRLLSRRPMPVSVHWSESQAELDWLREGSGDFAPFFPASPGCSGLQLLEQAGLLNSGTSLVHGNLPQPGEPERIARAGSVLVHCPGTHRFFDRAAFPWQLYRRAGVQVALGSDSLASNGDLDMRREMALARASNPDLEPRQVLAMATHVAAQALGLGGQIGAIEAGQGADLAFHEGLPGNPEDALEALTSGAGQVGQVYVAGRRMQ